jgi:RimJ/RimL family protein N-acetyltransferase
MEPVSISAGRLHLRPWEPGDVEVVLRAGTDPQVQRWTQVPRPYTRGDAEDFVCRYVPRSWAEGGELVWAVCEATSGEPLASVGLHAPSPTGVREVGFWCLPEARGRGVVPAALHAVARWAFSELRLPRVEWATEVGNAASLRAAVKAGFAFEGRRRASLRQRDGSLRDGWWAARLPADGPEGVTPALPDPGTLAATTRSGRPLRLRRWRPADAGALAAAVAGERHALPPRADLAGDEHARWWVAERSQENWAAGDGAPLAVLGDDGEVLGSLQLMLKGRRRGIAEVGVWVHPAARRRGTATAAITTMLAWAEPALALSRVEWHAAPDNAGSLALAARLGFRREGLARGAFPGSPGEPRGDAVILARTAP